MTRRHHVSTVALTVMIAVAATTSLCATAVVILTSADRIVVAADSRVSPSLSIVQPDDTACKIWQVGSTAAAMSGDVATVDGGFDARELIPKALAEPGTVRDKYVAAVRLLGLQIRTRAPFAFVKLGLAFASFEPNRGPDIAVGKVAFPGDEQSGPQVCNDQSVCAVAVVLGDDVADDTIAPIERELRRRPRPSERWMIDMAKALVRRLAKRFPEQIGGPTDVLVIDVKGARWISRKPSCR